MDDSPAIAAMSDDARISEIVTRERSRLRAFIRRRVPDAWDVEDILQDVFYELVDANRLLMPIEHVTAWLFRVARNRIIDLFRKKKPQPLSESEWLSIEELLPSLDGGPEAAYARGVMLDELDAALDELPAEQRDAFVAHELQGKSFKELAAESGVPINTLLTRKHAAVVHLRKRLQSIDEELGT